MQETIRRVGAGTNGKAKRTAEGNKGNPKTSCYQDIAVRADGES
jgi:hypothetical protein